MGRLAGPSPVPRATLYPPIGYGGSGAAVGGDAPIPAGPGSAGVDPRNERALQLPVRHVKAGPKPAVPSGPAPVPAIPLLPSPRVYAPMQLLGVNLAFSRMPGPGHRPLNREPAAPGPVRPSFIPDRVVPTQSGGSQRCRPPSAALGIQPAPHAIRSQPYAAPIPP